MLHSRLLKQEPLQSLENHPALQDPEFFKSASELVSAIRTYSEVKVIRRRTLEVKKPDISPGLKDISRENQVIEAFCIRL